MQKKLTVVLAALLAVGGVVWVGWPRSEQNEPAWNVGKSESQAINVRESSAVTNLASPPSALSDEMPAEVNQDTDSVAVLFREPQSHGVEYLHAAEEASKVSAGIGISILGPNRPSLGQSRIATWDRDALARFFGVAESDPDQTKELFGLSILPGVNCTVGVSLYRPNGRSIKGACEENENMSVEGATFPDGGGSRSL